MVQHGSVANLFAGMDRVIGCHPEDALLAVTSISFDISVLELFWTLTRGGRVVLMSEQMLNPGLPSTHPPVAREIQFSLFYFASDSPGTQAAQYRLVTEGARFADRNGFTAVWTPERHFHEFGGLYPNPSVTSAALATVTERIQLRAGSVVLPLHDPLLVAEEWAVVDNLSHGRVAISFASGWQPNDFVIAPQNYAHRKGIRLRGIEPIPGPGGGDE